MIVGYHKLFALLHAHVVYLITFGLIWSSILIVRTSVRLTQF